MIHNLKTQFSMDKSSPDDGGSVLNCRGICCNEAAAANKGRGACDDIKVKSNSAGFGKTLAWVSTLPVKLSFLKLTSQEGSCPFSAIPSQLQVASPPA